MRSFYLSPNIKVRGQRRRFRWFRAWSRSFEDWFPTDNITERPYYNWKLPMLRNLVEGKRARHSTIIECAQLLLNAAGHLRRARPEWAKDFRVVCGINVPDMFGSEVCIYNDEEYFQYIVSPIVDKYETKEPIVGKSLARRWRLVLPEGFGERGVRVFHPDEEDGDYRSDWWFFGDVD